jgi:citrate lyase gamma subunit
MRANVWRSAGFLVLMTVVLVGWGASLGSHPASGSSPRNLVDQLPYAAFLGYGPGTFTLSNAADNFLVKEGRDFWQDGGPSYTATAGQYVWEISGDSSQFTFFLTGEVDLGVVVDEGCLIRYLHLDDESDTRINRFWINGEDAHVINPDQIPEPESLVIYDEFVAPMSGALSLRIRDSGALAFTLNCASASIEVAKTANPTQVSAAGDPVQFTVQINNTSQTSVTINSLTDDQFGNLNGQGTCSVPQAIAAGGSYTCAFTVPVPFDEGSCVHTNVVTAAGQDAEGELVSDDDEAEVTLSPCLSIDVSKTPNLSEVAPGGDVEFTVAVANTGPLPVTINSLTDDVFGDLDGEGSCSVPQTIDPGESYECSFTGAVNAGENSCLHTNTVTAVGEGPEGGSVQDSGGAEVAIVPCAGIDVTKTPDPAELPIPGGEVSYTVAVANTGLSDVTIDSLTDDMFGDLNGQGSCAVPQTIAVGESYECSFTANVQLSLEACTHVNVVTAAGLDVQGQGTATVSCLNQQIEVTKTPNPAVMPVPGGNVQYTVVVANTGTAEVTIDSLMDDKFGDLNGQGSCSVPQTLATGDSYSCVFTGPVVFSSLVCSHVNTVIASGPGVSGEGSATVRCSTLPPPPEITVVKTPNPARLPLPGGDVAYTVMVTNEGNGTVTIDSLTDDQFGNLNGQGDCSVPQTIPAGGSYSCTFSANVTLDPVSCSHVNTVTASGNGVSAGGSATVSCEDSGRSLSCLRINFELGPDSARRGTYLVRETGGRLLANWWAEDEWTDSGWFRDIDISAPAVYVQVIFVKGDGTETNMRIVNPAPGTEYGWVARGQCHAVEVAWP